jgi:hypothetical protein
VCSRLVHAVRKVILAKTVAKCTSIVPPQALCYISCLPNVITAAGLCI